MIALFSKLIKVGAAIFILKLFPIPSRANPLTDRKPLQNGITPHHEKTDLYAPGILYVGVFILIGALGMQLGMVRIFNWMKRSLEAKQQTQVEKSIIAYRSMPPFPRLQDDPANDLCIEEKKQSQILNSYAWVDRSGNKVRIPIKRAMEILADEDR